MGGFFKGWRRKTGLVTLGMTCLFAVAWLRSHFVEDRVAFTRGKYRHAIVFYAGGVGWDRWLNVPPVKEIAWSTSLLDLESPASPPRPSYYRAAPNSPLGKVQFESWAVSYRSLAVPVMLLLTLISARLILAVPKTKRAVNPEHVEPSPESSRRSNA